MLFAAILLIIFVYVGLGLVLWCLCPDMEVLLDLTSGLGAWVHLFFYQLVELVKSSLGFEPMPLGGQEQVPSADGDILDKSTPLPMKNSGNDGGQHKNIDTIPTSLMIGQGQVGGGRRELDLNQSADPEITLHYPYKRSVDQLTQLITNLRSLDKEGLFPNYNRGLRIKENPEIQATIADFLKQRDASTLKHDSAALVALGRESSLWKEFIDYQLQKQDRGV
jgi:hypothetical protein